MRIILLVLLSLNFSFSQNITLRGKVFDSLSGNTVQGAIVFIPGSNISYTNSDGVYEVKNLQEKLYTVKVSQIGYITLTEEIEISSNNHEFNFILEPSPIMLDEVIVSVDRLDKYLKDSPYSIVLADKKQIESKNFQSLSEVLDSHPGISMISDGVWSTDLNIRGLSRNNIVTIVDGTRIETANNISARLSMIDLNDVDRIEVIKGAASSVYGTGATGGIVNIVSRQPSFNKNYLSSGSVTLGYNSVNNLRAVSGNIFNSGYFWSSKISGSYRKADNIETPSGELKNSQFTDYSLSASMNILPFSKHLFKFNYQLFKAEDVGIPGAAPLFPDNADVRYPNEKRD